MPASDLDHRYQAARQMLSARGQEHVLSFWEQLEPAARGRLLGQIEGLDFDRLDPLIRSHVVAKPDTIVPADIGPAPFFPRQAEADQQELYKRARKLGSEAIGQGKVALLTVAGGQGTRLGFEGPKGAFCISPVRNKSLFQLFAESLLANQRRYERQISWYIMTSPANDRQIREFFKEHDYFDLSPETVSFFTQGVLPAFDFEGKLILAQKDSLALSPNGHGGTLLALKDSGCLDKLRQDRVEYVSYVQVDNPLVSVLDPMFIGLHIGAESEISSKSLPKVDNLERVGNFCVSGGKLMVIEYSDLSDKLAQAHNPDGSRTFNAASIAVHVINVDLVDRLTRAGSSLPYHRAEKKVAFVDPEGLHLEPAEANAVKLEMFIFDALPLASKSIIFEADRAEEFSPVKNAVGTDSPRTCRRDMIRRAARWFRLAGIELPHNPQGEPACSLEISPLFALDAEEFIDKSPQIDPIEMGDKVYLE